MAALTTNQSSETLVALPKASRNLWIYQFRSIDRALSTTRVITYPLPHDLGRAFFAHQTHFIQVPVKYVRMLGIQVESSVFVLTGEPLVSRGFEIWQVVELTAK